MSRRGWAAFVALALVTVGWVLLHADPAAFDPGVAGWPRVLFGQLGELVAR
jgi:hypothetical protein